MWQGCCCMKRTVCFATDWSILRTGCGSILLWTPSAVKNSVPTINFPPYFISVVCHSCPGSSARDICGGGCDGEGLLLYCDFAELNEKGNLVSNRKYQQAPEIPQLLAALQKWILLQTESAGKSSGVVVFACAIQSTPLLAFTHNYTIHMYM